MFFKICKDIRCAAASVQFFEQMPDVEHLFGSL
jgi:hypothetical protein